MNPNQTTIDKLSTQVQGLYGQLADIFKARGLTFDAKTNTAIPVSTISPQQLDTSQTPIKTPSYTQNSSGIDSFLSGINTQASQYAKEIVPENAALKSEVQNASQQILDMLAGNMGETALTDKAYKDAGVDKYKKELDTLNAELEKRTLEYRRQIEDVQKGGGNESVKAAEVSRISQDATRELADKAILVNAARGNYDTAKNIADRAVALQTERQTSRLNALEWWYDQNKETLNKEEQRRYELTTSFMENQIKFEQDKELKKYDLYIKNSQLIGGTPQTYENDLDAIIGTTISTISTKFGQQMFNNQLLRARNDADKINLVASQVLKSQPSNIKTDFVNQTIGINEIDKALKLLDEGVQTGALNNAKQYAYNVVGKDFDPQLAKINGYITAAIQPYRNSVTGAAWGQQEDGEYQALFGSTKYAPQELRQRLLQVRELLVNKSVQGLSAYVNPLGLYDNPFSVGTFANSSNIYDQSTGLFNIPSN